MMVLGVDPGKRGGIACVGGKRAQAWAMPLTPFEYPDVNVVAGIMGKRQVPVFIEKPFPNRLASAGRLATQFAGFGILVGAFLALGRDVHLVEPRDWQPFMAFGAPTGDARKPYMIKCARKLFPGVSFDGDGMAEALLIAEYGRRTLCL